MFLRTAISSAPVVTPAHTQRAVRCTVCNTSRATRLLASVYVTYGR